jgi:hypothetical protein
LLYDKGDGVECNGDGNGDRCDNCCIWVNPSDKEFFLVTFTECIILNKAWLGGVSKSAFLFTYDKKILINKLIWYIVFSV